MKVIKTRDFNIQYPCHSRQIFSMSYFDTYIKYNCMKIYGK
jgi:hypothetical protein